MATQKQIEANRLNATKSTGPRSPEGKSATRFNALKHGIFAEAPILIGEDAVAFQTLSDSYLDRFQPAAPEEETLLSNIIGQPGFSPASQRSNHTSGTTASTAAPTTLPITMPAPTPLSSNSSVTCSGAWIQPHAISAATSIF